MDRQRLYDQLKQDEGHRLVVYTDTRGFPTVGIGHHIQPIYTGDTVSQAQVNLWFDEDVSQAIQDCLWVFPDWESYPDVVQEVVVNMMFNVGRTRFLDFQRFIAAIQQQDWVWAALEMHESLWAQHFPARARRLIARMHTLQGRS
jgi:GH24 family phage-related lysozyme (muramidase)